MTAANKTGKQVARPAAKQGSASPPDPVAALVAWLRTRRHPVEVQDMVAALLGLCEAGYQGTSLRAALEEARRLVPNRDGRRP